MSRKINKPAALPVALFQGSAEDGYHAAIADGVQADAAHSLAESFGLLSVDLDDRLPEAMMAKLARVPLSEEALPELPAVGRDLGEALMTLAVLQGRAKIITESAADGEEAAAAHNNDNDANGATATPKATETPAAQTTASAPAAAASQAVVSDDIARQVWPNIAAGQVVLVPDHDEGAFSGFWPALVVNRSANEATLRWVGFEDLPQFVRPITQMAVTHPAYRG